ncbi:MAG: nicotinate-nucleotide adenylyltransferase [Elusimicrobiota bacterium]
MVKIKRIGLFGGSFDPVHAGHLKLASLAKKEFRLGKVIFIPAFTPPHKKHKALSNPSRRLKMLSLAIKPHPSFSVSRFELNKRKPVFTYRTLEHFSKKYRGSALFFILGSDSLADIKSWKRPGRILELSELIVGVRKGAAKPGKPSAGRVHVLRKTLPSVSSTGIRMLAQSSRKTEDGRRKTDLKNKLKGLVPNAVASYIIKNGIYN